MVLFNLAGTAQAKDSNRLSLYYQHKSKLEHATSILAEKFAWKLVGHQHQEYVPYDATVGYYRSIVQKSRNAIRRLIPHKRQWLCIHHYEGSWYDSGFPYFGGLQMDMGFQQHYGRTLLAQKGTANNWTPVEQMIVAENAYYAGRGFYPWPTTARHCGLI